MSCTRFKFGDGSTAIINVGGPTRRIRSGGKEFLFEFHEYLGPTMIGKRGDTIQSMPPMNSPFWDALHFWLKQGKQVDAEGNCIFEHEMKLVHIVKQLDRRNWKVLG